MTPKDRYEYAEKQRRREAHRAKQAAKKRKPEKKQRKSLPPEKLNGDEFKVRVPYGSI